MVLGVNDKDGEEEEEEEVEEDHHKREAGVDGVSSRPTRGSGGEEFISLADSNIEPPPDLKQDHSRCILHFDIDCFYAQVGVRKDVFFLLSVAYRKDCNGVRYWWKTGITISTHA